MPIGPFWCAGDKVWLRFNYCQENKQFYAETATADSRDNKLATAWQPATRNFWIANYDLSANKALNDALLLKEGKLYRTDYSHRALPLGGKVDRLESMNVHSYSATDQLDSYRLSRHSTRRDKIIPFPNEEAPPKIEIDPTTLPLTPEQQEERQKQQELEQAENRQKEKEKEKERIQMLQIRQEELEKKQKEEVKTFVKLRYDLAEGVGGRLELDADMFMTFNEELGFLPDAYTSETFIEALKRAVTQKGSTEHKALQTFFASTLTNKNKNIIIDPNTNPLEANRIYKLKQEFAYQTLLALIEAINKHRGHAPENIAKPEIRERPVAARQPRQNHNARQQHQAAAAPAALADPANQLSDANDPEIQAIHIASLKSAAEEARRRQQQAPVANRFPDANDAQVEAATAASIETAAEETRRRQQQAQAAAAKITPSAPEAPRQRVATPPIQEPIKAKPSIEDAVTVAVANYKAWYKGENPDLRGKRGYFTWFRHGDTGQKKADALLTSIENAPTEAAQIGIINNFLKDSKTRYHRHSLASFLLDELTGIEGGPWKNLKLADSHSNLYNPEAVRKQLTRATPKPAGPSSS